MMEKEVWKGNKMVSAATQVWKSGILLKMLNLEFSPADSSSDSFDLLSDFWGFVSNVIIADIKMKAE